MVSGAYRNQITVLGLLGPSLIRALLLPMLREQLERTAATPSSYSIRGITCTAVSVP